MKYPKSYWAFVILAVLLFTVPIIQFVTNWSEMTPSERIVAVVVTGGMALYIRLQFIELGETFRKDH